MKEFGVGGCTLNKMTVDIDREGHPPSPSHNRVNLHSSSSLIRKMHLQFGKGVKSLTDRYCRNVGTGGRGQWGDRSPPPLLVG